MIGPYCRRGCAGFDWLFSGKGEAEYRRQVGDKVWGEHTRAGGAVKIGNSALLGQRITLVAAIICWTIRRHIEFLRGRPKERVWFGRKTSGPAQAQRYCQDAPLVKTRWLHRAQS